MAQRRTTTPKQDEAQNECGGARAARREEWLIRALREPGRIRVRAAAPAHQPHLTAVALLLHGVRQCGPGERARAAHDGPANSRAHRAASDGVGVTARRRIPMRSAHV